MRLCSVCEKRVTINEDGICDICRGDAGYDVEGHAFRVASHKGLIELQREEERMLERSGDYEKNKNIYNLNLKAFNKKNI